ncbi:hypothetical protein [Sphingomonas azotifigens]|uniref:hypothetical protein n=1 Tax=Sphingomonas azotifigens TaxID=330920 RepID=UPI00111C05E0|nr:hypothetical protein [Sphingomonas azotifigens]
MPALIITTVDGEEKQIEDTAALEAEIARFEEALQALVPDLEGDDEAGDRAVGVYRMLCYNLNEILSKVEERNDQVNNGGGYDQRKFAVNLKRRLQQYFRKFSICPFS